jgi:hypothetical protein
MKSDIPVTLDEDADHFAALIVDRERRAGICQGLIHWGGYNVRFISGLMERTVLEW